MADCNTCGLYGQDDAKLDCILWKNDLTWMAIAVLAVITSYGMRTPEHDSQH